EHLCSARRQDPDAAARRERAAWDHARHGNAVGRRPGDPVSRDAGPARAAVHRRRSILLRHRGRSNPDPLDRSHHDWQRQAWPDHRTAPARILQPRRGAHARSPRLAYAGGTAGQRLKRFMPTTPNSEQLREWVKTWQKAAPELEAIRRREIETTDTVE